MRFFKSDINVIDSFDYKILKNFQIRLGIREKKYVRGDLKYSIWKSSFLKKSAIYIFESIFLENKN